MLQDKWCYLGSFNNGNRGNLQRHVDHFTSHATTSHTLVLPVGTRVQAYANNDHDLTVFKK